MAIDTRDERFSMIGLGLAHLSVFPDPDGTIDQGDRQQWLSLARGIPATFFELFKHIIRDSVHLTRVVRDAAGSNWSVQDEVRP